jgi:DNA-nicking Smr family endonuclease
MRRLTAHERALWARVAASVKPLPGREVPALPATPELAAIPSPAKTAFTPGLPKRAPAALSPKPKIPHPLGASLDGSWDRQIARGRLTPDRIVDLHGHTLATAHGVLASAIVAGYGARVILVITGKGRPDRPSRIRDELMHWLERPDLRAHVASLRNAHPRHGGSGAFYIILRRAK